MDAARYEGVTMEHTRKPYQRPRLIECGEMRELTLGSTGPNTDYIFSGTLNIDTNAPGCTTNGPSGCVNFSH